MSLTVKICGLSTPETLDASLDAGADMVGFVFFPPSPRHLQFDVARALGERVRGRAQKVALTVDADDAFLQSVIEALKPDIVQLHGAEPVRQLEAIRRKFGLPVMKAVPIAVKDDLERIAAARADLIIVWGSGFPPAVIEALKRLGPPVYVNEPGAIDSIASSMERLGTLVAHPEAAVHHPCRGHRRLVRRRARARGEGCR